MWCLDAYNEITRRMRSETAARQRCLAQFTVAPTNKGDGEWFIVAGLPGLTHSVPLAASSVPSEQPDSWLNKQRGEAVLHDRREAGKQKLFQLCRPAFRHLRQQRGFFYAQRLQLRIKCEKAGKYQKRKKCTCSEGRQIKISKECL